MSDTLVCSTRNLMANTLEPRILVLPFACKYFMPLIGRNAEKKNASRSPEMFGPEKIRCKKLI